MPFSFGVMLGPAQADIYHREPRPDNYREPSGAIGVEEYLFESCPKNSTLNNKCIEK